MDIVVSRFNENTSWTDDLTGNLFLYDKSESKITGSIPLENKNRESDTYLEHVLRNYKNINNSCVFLQGNPFDHRPSTIDDINLYKDGLVWLGGSCTDDGSGAPHHRGLEIGGTADLIGLDHNGSFEFAIGAQYIVPSENIRKNPLSWWEKLKEIHDSTPQAPWVFERLWPLIFS